MATSKTGGLKVTDVKIFLSKKPNSKTKAFASVTLNGGIALHNIKVIEGPNGLFMAMPNREKPNKPGEYLDVYHPITAAVREMISSSVLACYQEYLENQDIQDNE